MRKINTDSIPKEDILNREKFAAQISESLRLSFENGEDSFVFGLNGKWGSGKTTLMHYLKKSLKSGSHEEDNFIIFEFNPWMFSGREELISFFLNQLAKELSIKNVKLKEKLSLLAVGLSYLDNIKYLSSALGEVQELAKKAAINMSSKPSIHDLKNDIDEIIIEQKLRIFVFIDDLDRLTPKEVIEIFQIVKLNASFKNTIFVISYDKEVVQDILELHHGFDGEKYLEKIIQVDYRIPDLLEETLQSVFFNLLKEFLNDIEVEYSEDEFRVVWIVKRLKFYFVTLRDVHRYFNALKLRLPAIKQDVNVLQFCIIEAIRIFDYGTYEIIQKNYKKGIQFGPQTTSSSLLNEIENENTQVLYSYLFGKTFSSRQPFSISDPQFFDRYFALSLSTKDIKEETIDHFIAGDITSRLYIIKTSTLDGTIQSFLSQLKKRKVDLGAINSLINWSTESELEFIKCIDDFLSLLTTIIESSGDFAKGLNYLLEILPGDDGYFNPARFYLIFYFNHLVYGDVDRGFFTHLKVIENHKDGLYRMEQDILRRYVNDHLVFSRPSTRTNFFHTLFLKLYRDVYPDDYQTKLNGYLDRLENIFVFLGFFIYPNRSKEAQLDEYWVKNLLNIAALDVLENKLEKIDKNGLTKIDKRLYELFVLYSGQIRIITAREDTSNLL